MVELREVHREVSGVKEAWLNSVDEVKRIISEKITMDLRSKYWYLVQI